MIGNLIAQGPDELAVAAFSYMAAMSTAWLSIHPSFGHKI
jgi:hypothetical protein